jgi:hypothetical protein
VVVALTNGEREKGGDDDEEGSCFKNDDEG